MKVFSATDIGQKRTMNQDFVFALLPVASPSFGHNAGDLLRVTFGWNLVKRDTNFNPVRIILCRCRRHGRP